MDGAESVLSGRSERSERSHRSSGSGRHRHRHHDNSRIYAQHRMHRNLERQSIRENDRDDRSVTIKMPGDQSGDEEQGRDERIQVQILQQDDNWGDNTTAITGNTSETAFSMDDMHKFAKEFENPVTGFQCSRYSGLVLAAIVSSIAFLSPIAMVVLPKVLEWRPTHGARMECDVKCEGLLISLAFKLLILLLGALALFFRRPKATMPHVFVFRALVLFKIFVLTFAFWLFYGVKIFKEKKTDFYDICLFAVSLVDALLFIHYLAVILVEIRQLQAQYTIKVVRSPDGVSRSYNIGALSIQRAAAWVLQQYQIDFDVYNPYLDTIPKRSSKLTGFKFYNVDGLGGDVPQGQSRAVFAAAARKRDTSHNDRFYEEQEYERRVRKRRARLMVAAEEAFTHIKRLQDEQGPAIPMDPQEAAQAVFPSMARSLQKYLRVTRQQPRYTMESVLAHLTVCIGNDVSPRGFLERYLTQGVVIWNDKDYKSTDSWVLLSEQLLTREIEDGSVFQLRQNGVSLLCYVRRLPHFSVREQVLDPKYNKFVLRLNSETSV